MASLAADTSIETRGTGKAAISTHPLFPIIVALWFAALLGLGSLILPTVLLERLVTVSGLSSILPMAAPPLGFTARMVLASGAGALGALIGLFLAHRIAPSQAPSPSPGFGGGAERACRPISAHELDAAGLGSGGLQPAVQKRRSATVADGNFRSEDLQHVPLPELGTHRPIQKAAWGDALELGQFVDPDASHDESDREEDMTWDANSSHPQKDEIEKGRREFPVAESEAAAVDAEPDGGALAFAAPSLRRQQEMASFVSNPLDLNDKEPIEPSVSQVTSDTPVDQGKQTFDPVPPGRPRLAVVESEPDLGSAIAAGLEDRPLDDLGLVQLAGRLGASIERHRAMRRNSAHADTRAPVFAASGEDFDAAAAEDAARARANFFAPSAVPEGPAVPEVSERERGHERKDTHCAPLLASKPGPPRSLSFEEEDESAAHGDLAASFSLPNHERYSTDVFAEDDVSEYDEEEGEVEYSSLLAMKNRAQKDVEFIRIDATERGESDAFEPTASFPKARRGNEDAVRPFDPPPIAQATACGPSDADETDRDLRKALATLQRLSGAA